MFHTSPYLSDLINHNMVQSEIEGGVHLDELSEGAVLEVETQHHRYTIVKRCGGEAMISGHPTTAVNLCRWGSRGPPGAVPC